MQPLDLTLAPPRAPRAELDGIVFLPRSIDKLRARLPGGNLGLYTIEGLTQALFETFGVSIDQMTAIVSSAASDDEVAAYVRARAPAQSYAAWATFIANREPRAGNRSEALQFYPWLAERPDMRLVLDVLEEDDRRSFAGPSGSAP